MTSNNLLILGLGNPGKGYEKSRHNCGANFVEQLSSILEISLTEEEKFMGLYGSKQIPKGKLHLCIPSVYVNESGKTTAIIDFGDMVYTFIACEPAVCIAYMVLDKKDPFDAAAQVLDGYHQVFHLSRDELMAVIYLVCVRSCITVTMAAYRKKLFPDNDYISVSDRQAWEFLTYMQKEDLNDWAEKLLQYVNS